MITVMTCAYVGAIFPGNLQLGLCHYLEQPTSSMHPYCKSPYIGYLQLHIGDESCAPSIHLEELLQGHFIFLDKNLDLLFYQ